MKTTRKIGIEMEGYINNHPESVEIYGVRIGEDGSLNNYDWEYDDEPYGVELRTDPLRDLSELRRTWYDMEYYGWHVDDRAGTHIHVDISDFSTYEMVKLLRFGKGIERIIFMFMQDYRYDNDYCVPIHKEWRKIFRPNSRYKDIVWDEIGGKYDVSDYLANRFYSQDYRERAKAPWNGKYQWLNVLGSHYPTAEFRLFHAVEDVEELIQQARLAEAIVNFVKNTSLEQMEFVIKELYKQDSVENLIAKFFEALGLDFELPVKCQSAKNYLAAKLAAQNETVAV
jgi:hypothetical protein